MGAVGLLVGACRDVFIREGGADYGVYLRIFGVFYGFGGITDVQQLDSAYIETKYDFLMDRVVYSDQLQTYLEAVKQMPNSTCTVFFHTKKNKLMEEYNKIRKRYSGDESVMLKELTDGGFKFQSPVYEPPVKVTPEPVESKAVKKEKKRKASKDKQEK